MYLEHFGLAESPFRITPHTEFFFSGANRGATLDALLYAIMHDEGIIKISGEVGSGKTMLCRVLMERLPKQVAIVYLCNPSLSREDILYAVADELSLSLPENARASAVLKALQTHLISLYGEGRRVVVLVDEAHAMPVETLEEVRLLSNLESNRNKLLQLVLFGQPELNGVLARADMRQLKERITHNFALEPLVRNDVAEYLEFRMRAAGYKGPNVFSPSATRLIYDASKGLTRRINILADKSLLAAFAGNTHQITTRQVRAAIRDSDFSSATIADKRSGRWLVTGIATAAVLATAALASLFFRNNGDSSTPPAPRAQATTAVEAPAVPATTMSPASEKQAQPAAVPTGPASLAEQALDRGRSWLAGAPDDRWFLQLYAVDAEQSAKIDAYLQRLGAQANLEQVHAYRSDLSGKMRYGIIYGDFGNRAEAFQAINDLPTWVQATKPYPRQVRRLR
jgi:MSHA biogenesis protein MshM